jgi:uncharacterized membrane protein (UPF0127 family)
LRLPLSLEFCPLDRLTARQAKDILHCGNLWARSTCESGVGLILAIRNVTRGSLLADRAGVAGTTWSRLKGLLNRSSLESGEGLWIPTTAIHTVGMRFPIDAVFLGAMREGGGHGKVCCVRRVYRGLRPWRMTRYVWGSESVLELPAGVVAATHTEVGDELEFQRV